MTKVQLPDSLFDLSLTPQSAEKKGYEYVDDIIYELHNPNEALLDILSFLHEFRGRLGTAASVENNFFGLYIPK